MFDQRVIRCSSDEVSDSLELEKEGATVERKRNTNMLWYGLLAL
jgi:predicted nucleic acid-binding Zn ribbon protein